MIIEFSQEFRVLATHLNFTTAANELGLSQSALSRHIAELEENLGFKLLTRSPVALTSAGQAYLSGISKISDKLDLLIGNCKAIATQSQAHVEIALITAEDAITQAIYSSLAKMHQLFPEFSYGFHEDRKLTIRQQVMTGAANLGVIYHQPDDMPDDLILEKLFDNPFGVVMTRDNPLSSGPLQFGDLSRCSLVCSTNRKFATWMEGMTNACKRYGNSPTVVLKDLDSITDFLISLGTDEILYLPLCAATAVSNVNPSLTMRRIDRDPAPVYPTYLLYRKDNACPYFKKLLETLREQAQHLRETGMVV